MGTVKNISQEIAKKLLFLLVGLALFAAPLSYKFYLFSSRQSIQGGGSAGQIGFPTAGVPDHHKGVLLSLDKRYDHKQAYGLVFPSLIPITVPDTGKPEHSAPTDLIVVGPVYSSYLRGPPGSRFIILQALL